MADLEAVVPLVAAITEETEDRSVPTDLLTISTKTVLDSPDTGFCLVADAGGQVVGVVLVTYLELLPQWYKLVDSSGVCAPGLEKAGDIHQLIRPGV